MKQTPQAGLFENAEDEDDVQLPVLANVTAFLQLIFVPAFILLVLAVAGFFYLAIE